jgi:hypothetical protein
VAAAWRSPRIRLRDLDPQINKLQALRDTIADLHAAAASPTRATAIPSRLPLPVTPREGDLL